MSILQQAVEEFKEEYNLTDYEAKALLEEYLQLNTKSPNSPNSCKE